MSFRLICRLGKVYKGALGAVAVFSLFCSTEGDENREEKGNEGEEDRKKGRRKSVWKSFFAKKEKIFEEKKKYLKKNT